MPHRVAVKQDVNHRPSAANRRLQGTSGAFARSLQSALSLPGFVLDQTVTNTKEASAAAASPILQEGRNCWRIAKARRAAVLVDGADYYQRLERALRAAQKSILIVGWDFDARIKLRPDDPDCPALGDFIRSLVEGNEQLQVRVLVWSVAVLHAPGAPIPLLLGAPWEKHPRIALRLDREHPLYGAHHMKIVCVDDTVAFAGGMDLTIRRWDTSKHMAADPQRNGPDGVPYPPVHDVQLVVDGEAALVVSQVARQRWRRATGEDVPPVTGGDELWPADLRPDFSDTSVAVSRTLPSWRKRSEVAEGMALALDALRAARHSIYMEAQYLTAPKVGDVLEELLARQDGPEVIAIVRRRFSGRFEGWIMGGNQARLIQRLRRCDRYGRFGAYYPVVPQDDGDCPITVHSKVIIVDDRFIRVGSSNLTNRSIALDSELDLAIEAGDEESRGAIAALRDNLIAEHLDVAPAAVRATLQAEGSLLVTIEKLGCNVRCLRRMPHQGKLPSRPVFGTFLLDPKRPFFLFPRKGKTPS
jgi:phosphatidylserine/phosphatidylglycerophosphate/cardiolipin synthase-like enzyme